MELMRASSTLIDEHIVETYGNAMKQKQHDNIRLIGQNIGCLGVRSFGNQKQEQGKNWLIQNNVDICCWQELGISLHMLKHQERLQERMKDYRWNKTRISAANNKHESIDKLQFGGTMTMAVNEVAARVHASGADERGLGRWTWLLFEGHNNHRTRIISAYVPCKPATKNDATVYQQQLRYLTSQGINTCPRKVMIDELTDQIQTWSRKGENIVLFVDCNENLHKQGQLQRLLVGEKCGLIDPIRMKFDPTKAPPTYHRNRTYPIDSVFVSRKLKHISKGGWLRFGEGIGDHRVIYMDIPSQLLLGENKFTIPPPQVRRLKCSDPRVVDKFNTLLEQQYKNHNVLKRIENLNASFHIPLTAEEEEELEKIDRISTFAVRHADNNCRKLHMGMVPFSDKLNAAGDVIGLWRLVQRKKKGCNVSTKLIKNKAKAMNISKPMTCTIEECNQRLKDAYEQYNTIKKEAPKHRYVMMDTNADIADANGDHVLANAIRQMKLTEETRNTHRKIKLATKPFGGAVSRLNIEDLAEESGRRTTTDPVEIEEALKREYEEKYRLAYSSPLLHYPLREELGDQGLTVQTEDVLLGCYTPPEGIDHATKQFLKYSKMNQQIIQDGPNDDVITVEQCNSFWRSMKEKIQSSKSNKHVGTYKAASQNKTNAMIQARLMSIPYEAGYSLQRWQEALNVSLLKKQEKYTPEDLRTIWYMEADCNGGSKIHFARRMMQRAKENNLISECQYAQKGKRAIEGALVKVLFLDNLRVNKRAGSLTMNDLMQCFDRMTHNVCSISSRRLGAGPRVVQSMLTTIQRMRHYIRTAYGDARSPYGNDRNNPLQGGGQGNGASMPFFVAISSILIPLLEASMDNITLYSAISLSVLTMVVIIYVDDSDFLIATKNNNETAQDVVRRTQHAANVWQESVHQTGGAIRPHKCRWSLVDFKWKNGIAHYKRNNEVNGVLKIRDTNGVRQTITRLQPNESEEGLGLHIPVDGSQQNQIDNINKKTKKWIDGVKTSSLTRTQVYISLKTSVSKTVTYSLTATSIDDKMMNQVSVPIYTTALPRMGIMHTLPLAFRYAPSRYHGIDLPYFPAEQIIQKTEIFLMHGGQDSQVGINLKVCMESIQLEIGVLEVLFEYPFSDYGHLTQCSWIRHLWKMYDKYNIRMKGDYIRPQLTREHDECLMEKLIYESTFTKSQIAAINRCRIYLQVLTTADIANGNGTFITKKSYYGERDYDRQSKYIWPNQEKPPNKDWRLWRMAVENIWAGTGTRRLRIELGRWIKQPHQHFRWQYSPSKDAVFRIPTPIQVDGYICTSMEEEDVYRWNNHILEYKKHNCRPRDNTIFSAPVIVCDTPSDLEYTTMERLTRHIFRYSGSREAPTTNPDNNFQTLQALIDAKNEHIQKILEHTSFPDNADGIAKAIRKGTAVAITDGSYNEDMNSGAAAWKIVGEIDDIQCEGRIGHPVTKEKLDSYRIESIGILAILTAVEVICEFHNIKDGSITVACDNDASLDKGITYNERLKTSCKYFDIFWATKEIKDRVKIKFIPKQVKGHQDKHMKINKLTRIERLNCYVDGEAKKYRKWLENCNEYKPPSLFGDKNWSLWIDDTKITKDIRKQMIEHIQGTAIKRHISQTQNLPMEIVENIDWDSVERASKKLTISRKIWLLKHVSGFAPTASKMVHRKEWDDDKCPRCQLEKEDVDHIMSCTNENAYEQRLKGILTLKRWMQRNNTAPDITECITLTLAAGPSAKFEEMIGTTANTSKLGRMIMEAAREQDKLGWSNFCRGRISKRWKQAQHTYIEECQLLRKKTSNTWACNFLLHIYELVHEQWEHRNEEIAKATQDKASASEKNKVVCEIRRQFELGVGTLRPNDHHYLNEGIENVLKKNIRAQKYWVRKCQVSRDYTENSEKNMLVGMRNLMRTWATKPD